LRNVLRRLASLLGSYGARDTAPHDLKIYEEAGHAFFDDTRASYVAGAASDSWRRPLDWFTRSLI
jgi:carboxymethylenebutenolidase